MHEIILASKSPRRQELLKLMGLDFIVMPSQYEEKLDDSRSPESVAIELALGKAMDVARAYPDHLVIGSDTIVTIEGRQLEKPAGTDEARSMLTLLAGKANQVTTGVAVVRVADGIELSAADTTEVVFKPFDATAIEAYVQTGDPLDKAGAYGIQSGAAPLIDHITGHYDTVVGLPTALLVELLQKVGVTARPVEVASPVSIRQS